MSLTFRDNIVLDEGTHIGYLHEKTFPPGTIPSRWFYQTGLWLLTAADLRQIADKVDKLNNKPAPKQEPAP